MARGQMLYAMVSRDQVKVKFQSQIRDKKQQEEGRKQVQKYQAVVRKVKDINIKDLLKQDRASSTKIHVLQLLNIRMKNQLKSFGFFELGRTNKYFEKNCKKIPICIDSSYDT